MFGVGMPELMIIFVIALLVFGPKELPKIARTLGKAMSELRRASDELRDGIQREIDLATREEAHPPPTPPEAVSSTKEAEVTPPSSEAQASMEAEVQKGETAAVPENPREADLAGPKEARLATAAGEQESQLVAEPTLPALDGQPGQPVVTGSLPPTGESAEPAEGLAITDETVKGVAQAAPVGTPKESSVKSETVPYVPAQPTETRNA